MGNAGGTSCAKDQPSHCGPPDEHVICAGFTPDGCPADYRCVANDFVTTAGAFPPKDGSSCQTEGKECLYDNEGIVDHYPLSYYSLCQQGKWKTSAISGNSFACVPDQPCTGEGASCFLSGLSGDTLCYCQAGTLKSCKNL
jgi:hypothetical protein